MLFRSGAGFGGCTVSLVKKDGLKDFEAHVAKEYERATGYPASFYDATLGDGIIAEKIKK